MKKLFLFLASVSVYSADLIFLSSDVSQKNIELIAQKYQQPLLLVDNGIFLIPSECQSERYFGGASEGVLNIVKGPIRAEAVLTTQEVFEAKDEKQIIKKIELDKTFAIAEGKIAKDFLEDKEGRGYGGASEAPLDTHNEIKVPVIKEVEKTQPKAKMQHPTCQMLSNGSGYKVGSLENGRLYENGAFSSIENNTVLFR